MGVKRQTGRGALHPRSSNPRATRAKAAFRGASSEYAVKIAERWFVWAGMVLLGAIALAGLVVAVYAAWLFHDLPDASELADYRPPTATRVYAGDGTLIGEFSTSGESMCPTTRFRRR